MKFLRRVLEWLSPPPASESLDNVYELLQQAHSQIRMEEYDKARASLLEVIRSRDGIGDPRTIRYILQSLGSTWLLTEQFEEGIAYFSEYIAHYPGDSTAYCERAGAFWYAGRFQEAIRDYSRTLELEPSEIMALSGRGQVLAETGESGRAIGDLDLALRVLKTVSRPDSSWDKWYEQIEAFVHNGRGFALAGLGQSGPAMDEFETSIKLSPENAWVYHNRAQVYDRTGDREKAKEDYQRALARKNPALSPIRKAQAEARVRELSTNS
jgi:tetratricopeptide (TPR) repeat protein